MVYGVINCLTSKGESMLLVGQWIVFVAAILLGLILLWHAARYLFKLLILAFNGEKNQSFSFKLGEESSAFAPCCGQQ